MKRPILNVLVLMLVKISLFSFNYAKILARCHTEKFRMVQLTQRSNVTPLSSPIDALKCLLALQLTQFVQFENKYLFIYNFNKIVNCTFRQKLRYLFMQSEIQSMSKLYTEFQLEINHIYIVYTFDSFIISYKLT